MSQLRNIMFQHNGGDIPSQYILADCIQIPTTAYINTGIAAIPRYTRSLFTVKWQGSSTGTRGLFGVRGAAAADYRSYCVFLTVSASGPRWDNCGGSSYSSNWSTGEEHTVELTHSGNYGQTIVDGNVVATGETSMGTSTYSSIYLNTIYTVATGSTNTGGTVRWKPVKIWQDGTNLSGDMVPVFDRVSEAGGMYDKFRHLFLPGEGSGLINAYDAEGNLITG